MRKVMEYVGSWDTEEIARFVCRVVKATIAVSPVAALIDVFLVFGIQR